MIGGILNIIRRESQRSQSQRAETRIGIVDSYDPDLYCAKVRIQPEDVLTGFLPVATEWVGNGWGIVCPPSKGDIVDVHFQEGGKNAGYISKRFYSSKTLPPKFGGAGAPSGEFWLIHKSGTAIKITNDTNMAIRVVGDLNITVNGNVNVTATTINLN